MPRRSNILFLTHRLPFPPNKGDKIRTFHALERLAASHDVYGACFIDDSADHAHRPAVERLCRNLFVVPWRRHTALRRAASALARTEPLTIAAYEDRAMRCRIAEWSKDVDFDGAVAFSACMAPYALSARARRRVLDLCDADSEKWLDYARASRRPLSWLYAEEGRRLRDFELECIRKFDATVVISERERALLREGLTSPSDFEDRLFVVPNGVEWQDGAPPPAANLGPQIVFVGEMSYRPNVEGVAWFVCKVWPLVLAANPRSRFTIVGRNPTRAVRRLAAHPGVTVTGGVPDVRPYLLESRVVIAPLAICRGQPNKVLEALAMQRPVVGTPAVAAALDATPDRHLLVGETPAAFARQIVRLCGNRKLCRAVAESGCRFAILNHGWPQSMRKYEDLVLGAGSELRSIPTDLVSEPRRVAAEFHQAISSPDPPRVAADTRRLIDMIDSLQSNLDSLGRSTRNISPDRNIHGRYRFSHLLGRSIHP